MKKLFNHRKRPYEDKVDYSEWDEFAEEGTEETYYADESDGLSQGEDDYDFEWENTDQDAVNTVIDGEYYAAGGMYVAEGEYAVNGEYVQEEYTGEEYAQEGYIDGGYTEYTDEEYAEGEYFEDDMTEAEAEAFAAAGYYAESMQEATDGKYYAEDGYGYDDYEEEAERGGFFARMGIMDKIIAMTGILVLVVALAVWGMYTIRQTHDDQVHSFVSVGSQLAHITLPGENGLLAIADAQAAKQAAADLVEGDKEEEDDRKEYDEEDYANAISVFLRLSSIQKDMKVKFTNQKTGKLISNVPFTITVTNPDGKKLTWKDDDMDGIIYHTALDPGKYSVSVEDLTGEKYKNYILPTYDQRVEVKKDIEYTKVDVSNEIKTEAEVDVNKEDTKKNETTVESKLQDTVDWVDSTTTLVTYVEVAKDTIQDPLLLVVSNNFMRLAQSSEPSSGEPSSSEPSSSEPSSGEPSSSEPSSSEPSSSEPSSSEPSSSEPSSSEPSSSEPSSSEPSSSEPSSEPQAPSYVGKISDSSKVLKVDESFTLTASAEGVNLTQVAWTSSNPSVATVDNSGLVTAVGKGMAIISYTASGTASSDGSAVEGLQGSCQVTVENAQALTKGKITLDKTEATVAIGDNAVVQATVSDFTKDLELKYAAVSADTTIADVAIDAATGKITLTGVAAGETTVTVSVDYAEGGSETTKAEAQIKVTVGGELKLTLDKETATAYIGTPLELIATLKNAPEDAVIKAESSDTTIAEVKVEKMKITVTGIKEGSANITVKYTYADGTKELKAICAVMVRIDPKLDKVNKLTDQNKNQIYVLDGKEYREAFLSDYYTATKFYVKGDAKYTGWQTIDGKVYYFDAEGKKVTGQQVIQGAKYNFGTDGVLNTGTGKRGIDVSKWNGNIDWNAVKNSGIEYVIIRCGYRGSSTGALVEDPKFVTNIKGATAAGLKVGVYFFSQAISEAEAIEEASMVLEKVRSYKISYPIFLDVEASGGRGDKIDKDTRTAVCKAFCQTIQSGGYTAGIYANKSWLTDKIDASKLSAYKIWLAQYASAPTYTGRYDMWQYQSTGKVSGISGSVDMNWSYLGY